MIYFYNKKIDFPGFDEDSMPVITGTMIKEGNGSGPVFLQTVDYLTDSNYFEFAKDAGVELTIVWLPSMVTPLLTFDLEAARLSEKANSNVMNITPVHGQIEKMYNTYNGDIPKEVLKKFVNFLNERFASIIPVEDAPSVVAMVYEQVKYEHDAEFNTPVKVGTAAINADFMTVTSQQIEKHNKMFDTTASILDSASNATLYQNACTDELFIKIPEIDILSRTPEEKISTLIPRRAEVCQPYTDVNAYKANYKQLNVPSYLIPMIEGNPDNNGLPIQENEKRYFDTLMDWTAHNVLNALGEGSELFIDEDSELYFIELMTHVYMWHWSHNRNVPVEISEQINDDSDDEDESSSSNNEVASKNSYQYIEGESITAINDAILALKEFMRDACAKLGYKVYPEAIVQLARWGTRKPTALVFEGYDWMFTLGNNEAVPYVGNISDYKLQETNGCQYRFSGMISLKNEVADSKHFKITSIEIPVGVILKGKLVHSQTSNVIEVFKYYAMPDFIHLMKEDALTIDGITYDKSSDSFSGDDSNNILIDIKTLLDDYQSSRNSFLQNPWYRDKSLLDLCLKFGSKKDDSQQNLMTIINNAIADPMLSESIKTHRVSNMDELREKMLSGVIYSVSTAVDINVASIYLPLLIKLNSQFKIGDHISRVLEIWNSVKEFPAVDAFMYASEKENTPAESEPTSSTGITDATKPVEAFGRDDSKNKEVSSVKVEKEVTQVVDAENVNVTGSTEPTGQQSDCSVALIKKPSPSSVFKQLIDNSGNVVGVYTMESANGKKKYIIGNADFASTLPEGALNTTAPGCPVGKIIPFMLKDVYAVAKNNANGILVSFVDTESIMSFVKIPPTAYL